MALSNSYDFALNRDEMIEEALENIGVKPIGDSTDTHVSQSAVRTFQLMLKSLQEKGLILWSWREGELPLVADTLSYTLGTTGTAIDVALTTAIQNPLEIADVRLRTADGTERPCNIISLSEYNNYVNKAAEGKIVNVALQQGLDTSTLFVWPVNTDTTDVLRFQYKQPLDDVDADDSTIAFPTECQEAVMLQLTARLASKFQLPLNERMFWEGKAKVAWEEMSDTEQNTSFFIQPNFGG